MIKDGRGDPSLCNGPTVYVLCASRSKHFTVIVRLVTLHLIIPTHSHGLDCMVVLCECVSLCVPECARKVYRTSWHYRSLMGFGAERQSR